MQIIWIRHLYRHSSREIVRSVFENTPKLLPVYGCHSRQSNFKFTQARSLSRSVNFKKAGHLKIMKLDTPEFHMLFTPELKSLIELFEKKDYELRIAGGAVRDLLLGKQAHDIDFATTATPTEMKEMFELAGVRMINMKGEGHGTITARINDKENFEVTTLRIDVRTDGRHAEVEFTKDWQLDANRRDLTINSLFLGFDGTVYDYFNGVEDIENRRVRFVGTPADRMVEDYLRILRYFRFYGRIAEKPDAHEEATLAAIKEHGSGLAGIAGEPIWVELKKILVGNHADSLVKVMADLGISQYIGLPKTIDVEEFHTVYERVKGEDPHPMTMMAALLHTEEEVYEVNKRLKVSTDELKTALFIVTYRDFSENSDMEKMYKRLAASSSGQDKKVLGKVIELLKYKGYTDLLPLFSKWEIPRLPVVGMDLIDKKLKKGPVFAKVLNTLRSEWIDSNFIMTKEELLDRVDKIVKEVTNSK